jgi:hypothetical protein
MIIPGEGFDFKDHPFDVPIMPFPSGFWAEIGHMDRDFWAFQGPFETFLYLDSDTICVGSLEKLVERVTADSGNSLFVQKWVDDAAWREAMQDPENPNHSAFRARIRRVIGKGPYEIFDPSTDVSIQYPFNAGLFAGRRLTIGEKDLRDLNRAERKFYQDVLNRDFSWKANGLFQRDQGRLNYLACKLGIVTKPLHPELICLYGGDALEVEVDDVLQRKMDYHIIHWTGAPRPSPSLFCVKPLLFPLAFLWSHVAKDMNAEKAKQYVGLKEVPGYTLWRTYYERSDGDFSLLSRLKWSWKDTKRLCLLLSRYLKQGVKRLIRYQPEG